MFSGIYIFIVAHMAAPLFRDFDNYAIKIVLQFGIIMPFIYMFICAIFGRNKKKL